ncbi:MAG: response regulator, partial [Planctomycetota bacterium]
RERVFEPFYTTKAPGEGSGLGLAIVRGIVEDLGGTVALEEGREGGASFVLSLPRAPVNAPPPATRTQTPPPPSSPKRPLRVLVVDDERAVARSLSLVLEPHAVAVAHSLAEAVSRAREDPFDALVCDLLMPDANGVEVYEAVVAAQPELKDRVVFMTGAVTPDALELPAGRPLLQKPFDIGLLRTLLAELTGDRPQAR